MSEALAGLQSALRNQTATRMNDPGHDLAHLDRVWRNAKLIAQGEKQGDLRILLAAAYLHDLVNLPKDHPERATASSRSAKAAAPTLEKLDFSASEVSACQHAIAAHSFSAGITTKSPEAKILQDADRLDALGAIGIARMFAISGSLNRPLMDQDDPFAANRALDDHAQALDHFATKLLRLPEMMQTKTGHKLARERAEIMQTFLTALGAEIGATPTGAFVS